MAKQRLEIEQDEDFVVLGISCHDKDYRLCWKLNKQCHLALARFEPGQTNPDVSSAYSYFKEDDRIDYNLIANRTDTGWLLPNHKTVDYFFTLCDPHEGPIDDLLHKIRSINNVLAVYEMDMVTESDLDKLILI